MTIVKTKINILSAVGMLLAFFMMTNCIISYKDYPKILPLPSEEKTLDTNFVYVLPTFPQLNLGGREALKNYFENKTRFKKTVEGVDVPKVGYLVNVKVNYRSPTPVATAFLGISTLTATLLPAWSTQDGYDVQYLLYKDGKKVGTYEYHIFRNYAQWLLFIPISWYNFETATEKEVFERMTLQFFLDAKEHF
ncbi:hypothetical protein EHQ82_04995 [Leptospira selangorensis]|uniref:Lipoprotein n=1 Tax=Leptospira selangorensis TaxID=2484982 RepID=A0ABY2NG87_9LEPT|nr:hypothetical protein [Leptospira selangorensis]TGM25893.1 hypothetical protein EHQ82_04995 [Leptospira selangorensis]